RDGRRGRVAPLQDRDDAHALARRVLQPAARARRRLPSVRLGVHHLERHGRPRRHDELHHPLPLQARILGLADGLRVGDRLDRHDRRRRHRRDPVPHPEVLGPLLGRRPMTATALVTTGKPAPRKKMTRKKWQTVVWFVALIAITLVVIYPLVWLFASTFKPNSEFGQNQGLIPLEPTLQNYATIMEGIGGVPMWRFFMNSLILAVAAVVGTLFSSSLAAYAFARVKFKGLGIFFS